MPSRLSPVKGGSAKTNPKQTASTVVKGSQMMMNCPKLLFMSLLNPRGSNPSAILLQLKYPARVMHPHLKHNPGEKRAAPYDLALWRTWMRMCIPVHHFLQSSHWLVLFSTPSHPPTGKFCAHAPARFVLPPSCSLFCCYASFSIALSQGDAFEYLSETITPLTLKKKGALAPQESYDDDAHDNSPTHPRGLFHYLMAGFSFCISSLPWIISFIYGIFFIPCLILALANFIPFWQEWMTNISWFHVKFYPKKEISTKENFPKKEIDRACS